MNAPQRGAIADADGHVGAILAEGRDITAQNEAERKLRESEARLAEAQWLARVGSWEWDIGSDTVTWSDELYRIYGVDPDEFEATYDGFLAQVQEDERERVDGTIRDALAR